MSIHHNRLVLPAIVTARNLEESLTILALNDFTALDALMKIQHRVPPEDFYVLLRVLDCKHIHGSLITQGLFELFDGTAMEYLQHVFHKAPCAICQEVIPLEGLLEKYHLSLDDKVFFARKFCGGLSEADHSELLGHYNRSLLRRFVPFGHDHSSTILYSQEIDSIFPLEYEENPFSAHKNKEVYLINNGVLSKIESEE